MKVVVGGRHEGIGVSAHGIPPYIHLARALTNIRPTAMIAVGRILCGALTRLNRGPNSFKLTVSPDSGGGGGAAGGDRGERAPRLLPW